MLPKRANGANNMCMVLSNLAQQELQYKWCAEPVVCHPTVLQTQTEEIDLYKLSKHTVNVNETHVYTTSDWGTDLFHRVQSKLYAMKAVLHVLNSCIQEPDYLYLERHCTWLFSPASPAHFYTSQLHNALKEEAATTPAAPLKHNMGVQFMTTVLKKLQGSGNGMQVNHTLHHIVYQMLVHKYGVVEKFKELAWREQHDSILEKALTALEREKDKDIHKIMELKHKQYDLTLLPQLRTYCWNVAMCQVYLWYVTLLLPLKQESTYYMR